MAGAGIPSLAFALAVSRALDGAVAVTICDPGLGREGRDPRAYALSQASTSMLTTLGVWGGLTDLAQPIAGMTITDSRTEDLVRPDYLNFDGSLAEPLAFMIEAGPLSGALAAGCRSSGVRFEATTLSAAASEGAVITATAAEGDRRGAALLVAADGARSRLREEAGIGWTGRSYRQSGIVATVSHERPHGGRAVQHFLPDGPFAILPLAGSGRLFPHRCSIVWTDDARRADTLTGAAVDVALAAVETRFGHALGRIALEGPLHAHPLAVGIARRFVGVRLALLGDAAHEIHPLAGQGLNLGLADAVSLAEHVIEAVRLGLDPGSAGVLGRYQQDRRFEAVRLAGTTDALNRLFSNDSLPVRVLRDLGLGVVDRLPGLKGMLAREAAGATRRAPRVMRGEPL